MALRRVFTLVLTGVCLGNWANPGLVQGDSPHSGTVPFSLRVLQRADDSSGLEEMTQALLVGLEEDPLLEIWRRNEQKPSFMDRLETGRLLKEWDRFGPWVKKHREDPDSPIPRFLLWDLLLSERWEKAMEGQDPRQWIWLADELLSRWEGGEGKGLSEPGQELRELKLLAALDRLLLKQARGNVKREPLVERYHRRILAVWSRRLFQERWGWLSEEGVIAFLKSLKEVAPLSPRERESFWPRAQMQETFEWIQQVWAREGRPTIWEVSHLTPEHFSLLAELSWDQAAALLQRVLPKFLYRSPPGYDSMGELDLAASFNGFWKAAGRSPELKEAFLAALAKNPVEKILDPLLEIAADDRELRTPILRFLAVLLNLRGWFFTDQDLPWVNLLYLMNRIETPEQHLWMQEINRLLLKGYSGRIGVPRESPLRPLTRPLENPDSFGPDLNGFIRREAHHVGGAHVLELVRLRLAWWATGDKTPLVEFLEKLKTVQAREALDWLRDREAAPEAEELGPGLRQVLNGLGGSSVDLLETAQEADLKSVRADLLQGGADAAVLDRLFDREIPLVRLLEQMHGPRTAEAALEAIQDLHQNRRDMEGWPGKEMERFLTAFRGEDQPAALQALAELQSVVRQKILQQAAQYPKWGASHREFYQREYDATSEVHHGIPAVRGYDPKNLNFQLYILLEYLRPLAGSLADRLMGQAQEEPGWPAQAERLKGFLQWLKATGPASQPLEDLLELADSENLTLARLRLIGKQLLVHLDQIAARQDERIGETIDAAASVLEGEAELHPEVLKSMGPRKLSPGRTWELRLRPHLGRQILAHRQAAAAARAFATLLMDRLNRLGEEELLKPVGPGESRAAPPRDWVPLTASVEGSGGLEHLGNKFRNLLLLHQWGHPVPPAVAFPIGKEALEVLWRMSEGVAQVEQQIHDRNLQEELGARFGDPEDPLLLSVRSGALVDLPGQLATLENVGISLALLPALERRIGSWAAWDAYRRFIQDFALSVYGSRYGFSRGLFDRIIEEYKQKEGVEKKIQLSAEQMKEIALAYGETFRSYVPEGIPKDPWEQLALAVQAVVGSWDQPSAGPILEIFGLAQEKGTAVILQAMVHGNFSRQTNGVEGQERSGAGVAFVSLNGTGSEKDFDGSFGQGAQGSDIADGVIIPDSLSRLGELMPEVFRELQKRAGEIQERNGEEREIEFTVQNGGLWILQDRAAPVRGRGLKFHRDTAGEQTLLGKGEGLAGGAVRGILAFPKSLEDPVRLEQLNRLARKEKVEGLLLAMDTAAPEDTPFLRLPGVRGFLAHRGGKGQHEGMIANLLGLTAVAGLSGMTLDSDHPAGGVHFDKNPLKKDANVYGVKEGDLISVDGVNGEVYLGRVPLATEPLAVVTAGLEELPEALSQSGREDSEDLKKYFRRYKNTRIGEDGPVVLFLFPPGEQTLDFYRARSRRVYVLKDEHEPSGRIDRETLLKMIAEVNPHFLATFVNDEVDDALLDLSVTPRLRGITHMGLGTKKKNLEAIARRNALPEQTPPIQVSYVGKPGAEDNVLSGATAERLEALFLTRWFDLLRRVEWMPGGHQAPDDRSWVKEFEKHMAADPENGWRVVADIHWAMAMRQAGRIDEAAAIPLQDEFRGALNGKRGTVRSLQLSSVPEIGLKTAIGLSGDKRFVRHWAELARAHRVHRIVYTGEQDTEFEAEFGAEYFPSLDEVAQTTHLVLQAPGDQNYVSYPVGPRLDRRKYRWLVNARSWAIPESLADRGREVQAMLDSTLKDRPIGFLGLGTVGSKAAQFMAPFGAVLQGFVRHPDEPAYKKLTDEIGMQYSDSARDLIKTSDGILAALPGDAPSYLAPQNLQDLDLKGRRVWDNVGRGTLTGADLVGEQAFADFLRANPLIEYATDVTVEESRPQDEQPLLKPDLEKQVTVTAHTASNAQGGNRVSVREDGMGKVLFQNYYAMLDGKPLPNPVQLPALGGLEESVEAKLQGTVFLVFDAALGWAMTGRLEPSGAEVFVVAETPAIALKLISNQVAPDHIVGVLYAPKPEIDSPGVSPADYWKVNDKIRRFAYGEGGPQEWGALFAKRMQEGIARRVIPIYSAEQMQDQLGSLGVPGPVIQQILDQQTGLEEAFAGQA